MEKFIASAFLILSPLALQLFTAGGLSNRPTTSHQQVLLTDFLPRTFSAETRTQFKVEVETASESIPFTTQYKDDSEIEWGEEEVIQEGAEGLVTRKYKVSSWYGREVERILLESKVKEPTARVVRRGTKKTFRQGFASNCGSFSYYGKFRVWATSYDKNCPGCNETTYTGMRAGYGIIAVDPKVIPLYTRVCIPGYGEAIAGDIGGAIKGKKIDLGFDDVHQGWWSARFTDIYLLE